MGRWSVEIPNNKHVFMLDDTHITLARIASIGYLEFLKPL